MVLAHRALKEQMLRKTVMASSEAIVLFDVGAGQVDSPGNATPYSSANLLKQAQGGREFQEDRCTVILPEQFPGKKPDTKFAFFAVYDGQ